MEGVKDRVIVPGSRRLSVRGVTSILRVLKFIFVQILSLTARPVERFRLNLLLMFLCIVRVFLTIYPQHDYELVPQVPIICEYLSIKLNDIVVVVIWILIPIVCGRSIVGQYGVLGLTSFRDLFLNIFSSKEVQIIRPMPILAIILTGISATYMPRLVYIIYTEWTILLNPLVQTLQIYPALMMVIQTLYQGTFLLQAYSQPLPLTIPAKTNMKECKKQLEANIILNATLLLHCTCIAAVVETRFIEKDIFLPLAGGEMVYRLWAVVTFLHLRWKIEQCSNDTDGRSGEVSTKSGNVKDSTCKAKLDPLLMTTPSKTLNTEDPNSCISDIKEAITLVDSDKGYELKNSEMVLLSSYKELQQLFEASHGKDSVSPGNTIAQAIEDEDYEQYYSKLVMQSLCKEVRPLFEFAHDQDLDLVSPQQCTCTDEEPSRDTCTVVVPRTPISLKFKFS